MNKGSGSTGAPLGVLAEITTLLASITPEQFIAPTANHEEGDHTVTVATDHIKQLFTLRRRLIDKCCEFKERAERIAEIVMKEVIMKGALQASKDLETPGSSLLEVQTEIEQIVVELQQVDKLREIVDGIFWLEIRRQHPDLADKSLIGIRSDWSLTWAEDMRISLVGSSDLTRLAEMLSRHTLQ